VKQSSNKSVLKHPEVKQFYHCVNPYHFLKKHCFLNVVTLSFLLVKVKAKFTFEHVIKAQKGKET
jgi:hypothetical protein